MCDEGSCGFYYELYTSFSVQLLRPQHHHAKIHVLLPLIEKFVVVNGKRYASLTTGLVLFMANVITV